MVHQSSEAFRQVDEHHTRMTPPGNFTGSSARNQQLSDIAISQTSQEDAARMKDSENARMLLAAIVDSSDDAIISKSLDSIITSWNAGAQRLFGYTASEVIGRSIAILFPPDRLHEEDQILARIRAGQRVDHFETVRVTKDGRQVDVSLTISPVRDASGKLIGASKIARDITERKYAQRMLEKQNTRLRLLNEAASHLLTTEEPTEMIHGLFKRVREHLAVDSYICFVYDDAARTATRLAGEGFSHDVEQQIIALEQSQATQGIAALRRGFPSSTHAEISTDLRADMLRAAGVNAFMCQPLLAGHRLLGMLLLASRTRGAFEEDEQDFFHTLCHYVSTAIERVRLVKQLREEDKKKNEFLATLAHELRNPLAPLRSSIDLMRIGYQDGTTRQQFHEIMSRQLNQLTRLVDDLLEMSRITSGKILLRRERVDIATIVRGAIDSSTPIIEKAGHKLIVSLPSEPIWVDADPVRLTQVFANLLNNAAKYTEENGTITVTVGREKNNGVIVSVRDTGLGIPADMLPRVFDMFAQVDRTLKRSQGGLGIGLALARNLIDLHGGHIEAHSEGPGRGSEFIVRLTGLFPSDRASVQDSRNRRMHNTTRKILVVDDNRDAATALNMLLQSFGHTTATAYDGAQAVHVAEEFRPDIVLMDLGMPHMDGYEAARRIRENNWGQVMVLVALSGWGQEDDRRKAREAGFNHHFTKPVDIDVVLSLLALPTN